jgi:hypothetical protein
MGPTRGGLPDEAPHRLEWLMARLDIGASDLVRQGVGALFVRERAKLPPSRLVEVAGGYALESRGRVILPVSAGAAGHLPEGLRRQLAPGTADVGDALVCLLLAAAKEGERVRFDDQAIEEVVLWGGAEG